MLKLYIGVLSDNRYGRVIHSPRAFVKSKMKDISVFSSDFGVRVLKECSAIKEVYNENSFLTEAGCRIGTANVSGGAKALMIMKATDFIVNMTFCGDNCNKFVAEIAKEKDLTVYTTRYYNPFVKSDLDKVLVLNNNKIYTSAREFALSSEIQGFFSEVGMHV